MRYGAIYERRGKMILHADGKTTAGVFIGIEPFMVLNKAANAAEIGGTLRRVLQHSRENLRHPEPGEWDAIALPLYVAAGVKSWGAFVRGAELTNVEADEKKIRLLPHQNLGARDGFQPKRLGALEVSASATDEELGFAVIKALEIARGSQPDSIA
jgi:hypothetical protein